MDEDRELDLLRFGILLGMVAGASTVEIAKHVDLTDKQIRRIYQTWQERYARLYPERA